MSLSNNTSSTTLLCGTRVLDLSKPQVMGIINVTPDSFSDGGRYTALDAARAHAERLLKEGAAILDIGGESTRPGAAAVSEDEEMARVLPVVEMLVSEFGALVSVDTSTPAVMREVAKAGAGIINDVRSLRREGALKTAAQSGLPVCLMHMQGEPQTMQQAPHYDGDVEEEVLHFLADKIDLCEQAGIKRENIILDPGFGFAKSLRHNLQLLNRLDKLGQLGLPLLVGLSRKSMINEVLDRPVAERLPASLALAVMAVERGANIIRAHDVAPTLDAIRMAHAVLQENK